MTVLNADSIIEGGSFDGKSVSEILSNNRKDIFKLLKEGYYFTDEVLQTAGIKKKVDDSKVRFTHEVFIHEKDTKVYKKDKDSLSKIIKSLNTITNSIKDDVAEDETEHGKVITNDSNEFSEIDQY